MANVADELITRYTLKDDYSGKLKNISGQTSSFAKHVKTAQQAIGGGSKGGGSSLSSAFTALKGGITPVTAALTAVTAAVTAVVGAGAGIAATAKSAIEAFAPYDTLQRTFEGIYGSAAKAKQMMSFLNSEAQKSNFLYSDLAQNAKLLNFQGMKWSDFSDSIQALAIRGGGTGEALGMATNTVTRIKGGDYGEAFENLRQFGYSRDVLTQMGLTFDKAGSYKGTMEQALTVIKKIGAENKGIVDAMNGGAEATIGNFTESFTLALADIGGGLFKTLKPTLEGISKAIGSAINSGAIRDAVSGIVNLFTEGKDGATNFTSIVASVLAGVQTAAAFVKNTWDFIKSLLDSPLVKALMKLVMRTGAGIGITATYKAMDLGKTYDNAYQSAMSRMTNYDKKPHDSSEPEPVSSPMQTPLQAIAENTKQTAAHTKEQADWTRSVFGGGDVGRMGLTPIELKRANSAQSNKSLNVKIVGNDFNALFAAAITQIVGQMRRQGAI